MKHKLKKILLLFVFTGTLFVSCTTEEEVVRNENYKSKFQVREQSYQELIKVNTFKRALDKIPKQKTTTTLNGKTVMEEQYGFSIIDTPIKITETDETIAYNLLVKSDTITEGNYFENLLINIDKQTNLTKAYLVKYNLEDTNLVYTNHNSFLFNGTRSAREIVYNNNPVRIFGKEMSGPCITYQILMCSYQGNHVAGEQCILNNFDLLYVQTQTSGDCSSGVDPIDTSGGIGGTTSSGGTTSNGNTNDGSINVIDNPTPSCTDCLELTAELDNFLGNLNETQLTTWNGLEYVVKRSIVSYLVQNNYSIESVAFVKEALIALNEGGKVDFTLQIIIAQSFKNNPCLNNIYQNVGYSPTLDNYLQNFEGSFSVANLKLSVGQDNNYPTANALTYPPNHYLIEIKFNPNNLSRPKLDVFRTLMHEMIHAEIFRKMMSCAGLPHVNYNNMTESQWENFVISLMNNYPGIHDYFIRYYLNTDNPTDFHHELMAQSYLDTIVSALKEFDNNSHSDDVYLALAWAGLMGEGAISNTTGLPTNPTVAWQNVPQSQRLQIIETRNNYLINNPPCQ